MNNNKRTTKQVIAEQPINRKLWAKENGRLHHVDANKLIAEFMGAVGTPKYNPTEWDVYITGSLDVDSDDENAQHFYTPDEMKYHTSWDWLMPVVQKCFDTQQPSEGQHYFINESLLTMDIEVVYDRVVEFIKEYNDGWSELQTLKRILIDEHPDTWEKIKTKIK